MGKLESIIRKKVLRAKPYRPAPNWDRMEAMLAADQKAGTWGGWTKGRIAVVALICAATLLPLSWWMWSSPVSGEKVELLGEMNVEQKNEPFREIEAEQQKVDQMSLVEPEKSSVESRTEGMGQRKTSKQETSPTASSPLVQGQEKNIQISSSPIRESKEKPEKAAIWSTEGGREKAHRMATAETSGSKEDFSSDEEGLTEIASVAHAATSNKKQATTAIALPMTAPSFPLNSQVSTFAPDLPSPLSPSLLKAPFHKKALNHVRLALGPGVNQKWAKARWAGQLSIVALSADFPLEVQGTLVQSPVVMGGLDLSLSRRMTPRLSIGAQASVASLYQVVLPPLDPLAYQSEYPFLIGEATEVSSFARWELRKALNRRFQPYLVGGIGLHQLSYQVQTVNSLPYQNVRNGFSVNNADQSTEFSNASLFTQYNLAVQSRVANSESDIAYTQDITPTVETAIMAYGGLGVKVRLYRRLSLSWQLSMHLPAYLSAGRRAEYLESNDLINSPINPDEPIPSSLSDVPPIGNDYRQGQYPAYFRQAFGLQIAF